MNLNQIKYFIEICKNESVSEAAKVLNISQPSLSNSVKDLENEFGVSLFKRHHKGMSLTTEGEKFYEMALDIYERTILAENIMTDMGKARKKLRLGVPPMIGSLVMSEIFGKFVSDNADIDLEIIEDGSNNLINKLSDNYIDLAFVSHNSPVDTAFESHLIERLEVVCCVSACNSLSQREFIKADDLLKEPLVLFQNSYFQTGEIKKWFKLSNVVPNILLQTNQLSTMLGLISQNLASGFLFKKLAERQKELICIPLYNRIFIDVSLVSKKNNYPFSIVERFKKFVRNNLSL
ncbi:MAG: LysR family transcriptional regulator [Clostridia bacterium]|nr:LysR family transcriptional regulator [Clostridia bacterium]